jgi:predicted dehydrogenase
MKKWKVTIARDTAVPCLGLHGLHLGFRGLPNVEVAGFFDSKADDIESIMAATEAKQHYRDYLQMLDVEKPDIVVLCSRHPYDHFPRIKAAIERGIHIYCEKPMTVSLKEADAIIELVEKNNVKICMAHPGRYYSAFLQMKEIVETGEIGRPLTIYGRGKSDHRGGGEDLMVLGTHILDLQTFFFGKPESVYAEVMYKGKPIAKGQTCETVEPIGPTAGDDIFAAFRFRDGVRGVFESRRGIFESYKQETQMGIAVIGTKGTLSLRFGDSADAQLRISRLPSPPDAAADYEEIGIIDERNIPGAVPLDQYSGRNIFLEGNRYAVWDLMRSIEEDRQPVSNIYNARIALEMIYGIYASSLESKMLEFPLKTRNHPLGEQLEQIKWKK